MVLHQKKIRRMLTQGERTMAYSVFTTHLNLDSIVINGVWWVLPQYGLSPNGQIYFNKKDCLADFSMGTIRQQAWFIHELAHVWQYQQGVFVVWHALINRRYHYVLLPFKSFYDYGVEQQATMIQDFYLKRALGQNCDLLTSYLPFIPEF